MRWVAYMPLRGGSKSIPGKNLKTLAGRPLFAWALGEAVASGCFDAVWAGTDSAAIRATVEREFPGAVRLFERSAATCTDEASTESALLEFAAAVEFDVLCTIQATSPLSHGDDFRSAQAQFLAEGADSLLTVTRSARFVWSPAGRPLNYDPVARPRRQAFEGSLIENGAFYFTKRAVLSERRCRLGGNIALYEMAPETETEVDEPEDFARVEHILLQRSAATARAAGICGLIVDVDGTLTDGGMYYGAEGEALKKFNTRDAHGFLRLRQAGIEVGVVTAEQSEAVHARMRKLDIQDYRPGCADKLQAVGELARQWGAALERIAYMGDDLNDLPALKAVGCACCPADAVPEVRAAAQFVAQQRAGSGAVREVCDWLLEARSRAANPD